MAPWNERALQPQDKELAKIHPLLLYIGSPDNDQSAYTLGVTTQALIGAFWSTHEVLHWMVMHPPGLCVLPTQAPQSCHGSPASKLLDALGSRLRTPSLPSWLYGATMEPNSFVVNHRKPRSLSVASTPSSSCLATTSSRLGVGVVAKPTNHRAQLCGTTEEPVGLWWTTENPACKAQPHHNKHRAAKPFTSCSQMVYSVLPYSMTRPLPCTNSVFTTSSYFPCHHAARTWSRRLPSPSNQAYLSLHSFKATQACTFRAYSSPAPRKSSRNLHLQYSDKNRFTPRCQSLMTKERPSTSPRMLQSSIPPLMSTLTTHNVTYLEKKEK
jgi:hypothetical protein